MGTELGANERGAKAGAGGVSHGLLPLARVLGLLGCACRRPLGVVRVAVGVTRPPHVLEGHADGAEEPATRAASIHDHAAGARHAYLAQWQPAARPMRFALATSDGLCVAARCFATRSPRQSTAQLVPRVIGYFLRAQSRNAEHPQAARIFPRCLTLMRGQPLVVRATVWVARTGYFP